MCYVMLSAFVVCQRRASERDGGFTEEVEMVRREPAMAGQGFGTVETERCRDCATHGEVAATQN